MDFDHQPRRESTLLIITLKDEERWGFTRGAWPLTCHAVQWLSDWRSTGMGSGGYQRSGMAHEWPPGVVNRESREVE
jgi:hypothetical protein